MTKCAWNECSEEEKKTTRVFVQLKIFFYDESVLFFIGWKNKPSD
jgi:hypothetical protein